MIEKKRVLLVEDEWRMRRLVKDFLTRDDFIVDEAGDGEEGYNKYLEGSYDLVILDVMMPKLDGWQVCKKIRESSNTPIIMLTARGEVEDELKGFELKADEYIKKPFNPKLLVARVNTILRRTGSEARDQNGVKIDLDSHIAYLDGEKLELTPTEFDLLEYFVSNKGVALSREKIIVSVWGWDYDGEERTVDTNIRRLRKKLGRNLIQTVRGYGYRYEEE